MSLHGSMGPFNGKIEEFGQQSFSEFGEDVVLFAWLDTLRLRTPGGFYVDVGAHHPRFLSTTYLLRKLLGWRGMNIEADPNLFKAFEQECPECVNLQMAVGGRARMDTLTIYNYPGVNTMSETLRQRQADNPHLTIDSTIEIPVVPINNVLEEYLPKDAQFRVLSIDVEGLDFEVIEAFDFNRWRPNLVLIEDFEMDLRDAGKSRIFRRMNEVNYLPASHCMVTTLYRDLL